MIDLQAYRCSQSFDFDSSAIVKRQTSMDEEDLVDDEHLQNCEERQPNNDYGETIDTYETNAECRFDDTDKRTPHDKAGTNGDRPDRKWVFLLLLGVALVSLIIGATSGTIATMLLNQVFSKKGTTHTAAVWTQWFRWSPCSVTCDVGVQIRTRECRNYNEILLGGSCPGISSEVLLCKLSRCTDGGWASWGPWGTCDRTCNGGVQTRTRQCTNPVPSALGKPCNGPTTEARTCNVDFCYAGIICVCQWSTEWTGTTKQVEAAIWSQWSSCSVTCDVGVQTRTRDCRNYNGTLLGSSCTGISSEAKLCKFSGCTDGRWANWGPWGTCDRTCDGGVQTRYRQCTNPVPSVLGRPCYGSTTEAQTCNMAACVSVYSHSWSYWSRCSVSCGRGFMIRTRGCSGSYHWTSCSGNFIQIQDCYTSCSG